MARDQNRQSPETEILERFKKGALLREEGYIYGLGKVSDRGLALIKQSIKELDALGPHGRNALLPLLEHSPPAIRVYAAAALVRVVPDRALSVLYEIQDRSVSDSNMTACRLLMLYEGGELEAAGF